MRAFTNTSITIQCPTSGVPTPTVTWTKDGQDLPSGGRYTVQDDDSLLIRGSSVADTARYTCTADSVAGEDSASSTVEIVGKLCEHQTTKITNFHLRPIAITYCLYLFVDVLQVRKRKEKK